MQVRGESPPVFRPRTARFALPSAHLFLPLGSCFPLAPPPPPERPCSTPFSSLCLFSFAAQADDWGVVTSAPVSRDEVQGALRELVRFSHPPTPSVLEDGPLVQELSPRALSESGMPSGAPLSPLGSVRGAAGSPDGSGSSENGEMDRAMAALEAAEAAQRAAVWARQSACAAWWEDPEDGSGGPVETGDEVGYLRHTGVGLIRDAGEDEDEAVAAPGGRAWALAEAPDARLSPAPSHPDATLDLVGTMLSNLLSNPVIMSTVQRELAADPAYRALVARAEGGTAGRAGLLLPPSAAAGARGAHGARGLALEPVGVAASLFELLDGIAKSLTGVATALGAGFVHLGAVLRSLGEDIRASLLGGGSTAKTAGASLGGEPFSLTSHKTQFAIAKLATAVAVLVLFRRVGGVLP